VTAKSKLQVLMFSATLHSNSIQKMSQQLCRFPQWVDLKGKDAIPEVKNTIEKEKE
jgi:superfamily II DNA/RNA helicase